MLLIAISFRQLNLACWKIVEMLETFSSSPDKSLSLSDFEKLMITAKLAWGYSSAVVFPVNQTFSTPTFSKIACTYETFRMHLWVLSCVTVSWGKFPVSIETYWTFCVCSVWLPSFTHERCCIGTTTTFSLIGSAFHFCHFMSRKGKHFCRRPGTTSILTRTLILRCPLKCPLRSYYVYRYD